MKIKGKFLIVSLVLAFLLIAGCGQKEEAIEEEPVETVVTPVETIVEEEEDAAATEIVEAEETENKEAEAEAPEAEPEIKTGPAELICSLPKNFVESGEEAGLFVHKSFPEDISTISHVIAEDGEDISQIEQEEFLEMLKADYLENYGDDIDITFSKYKKINIDGRPGISVKMKFEFKSIMFEQLVVMLYNGEESHVITYTQEKGNKWMDIFEKSAESIEFRELES